MVEAFASLAIERSLDFLIHETVFLSGVNEQVESLKAELERMRNFLKDADGKPEQDARFSNRVAEIRDLANKAEDVIEDVLESLILKAARQGGFHGIIKRFTSIFTKPFHMHKIGVQAKAIQTQLDNIARGVAAYEISGGGEGSSSNTAVQLQLRRQYSHVEEEDVDSLEASTKDVLAQLMKEEDRLHAVVSIVGMGGIGKTTLARKVYYHRDVRRQFDCLAWVCISQQLNLKEVLHELLIRLSPPKDKDERERIDKLTVNELIKGVSDALKEKLYLVVFDDIWRIEDWNCLKPAFPRGRKGSKILLTTRYVQLASAVDVSSSPIKLPFLTDDESWNLLRKKAFRRNNTDYHALSKEFEMLGREMVKKCGGLPLAIVVLGGLLATRLSLAKWEEVHRNIYGYLKGFHQQDHQYGAVNGIFFLSYNDLPYNLKPCFLYLAHYPEDWEISKKELIRLWIAEGLIEESGGMMEDDAERFLEELINRCLVQVRKMDYTGTGVIS